MSDEHLVAHSELGETRTQFEHLVLPQRKMAWVPLSEAGITQNVYGHQEAPAIQGTTLS